MGHPLVWLAALIDWNMLNDRFSSVCQTGSGQPGLPTRLVAGLFILKHMHNLSDEVLCARWIENPYYQYFCGELSFCHRLPFDRSSMTRWRQRLGEERLIALIQESPSVAHKTGAIGPEDLERVVVDTTVQPKAVAHPTDARLMHRAITKLVGLAKRNRVPLRQSYLRLAKRAAIMVGRYTHAHQFNRARRQSSGGRGLAGSSATSLARLTAIRCWKLASAHCSIWRSGCAAKISISAAPRSMRYMRRRSSASARVKPARLTSSAARSVSPPP
jgi:IS5 family transposase